MVDTHPTLDCTAAAAVRSPRERAAFMKAAERFNPGQSNGSQASVRISLERVPRFVSFDAGVVAALLGIGIYLAIVNRH